MKIQAHITLLMILVVGSVYAQEKEVLNKHSFGVHSALYTFYNGTPIIQTDHLFKPGSASFSFGLNYEYSVNEKISWIVTGDLYGFYDYTHPLEKEKGDIHNQNFLLLQGQCQYSLFQSNRSLLLGTVGLSVRGGSAVVFVSFNSLNGQGGPSQMLGKGYLDIGIPLGVNYTYYIGKHFHFNMRLTHTFFPYTYEKKTQYSWDSSPYRNMTSLSLGIGFNFGK